MSQCRISLAYAARSGATEEAASAIAEVLRVKHGFEVEMANLRKNPSPDLTQDRHDIVGSGVRAQRACREASRSFENDFGDRQVVFFILFL